MLALIPVTDSANRGSTRAREQLLNDRQVESVEPVFKEIMLGSEKAEQPDGAIITMVSKRKLWSPLSPREVQRAFRTGGPQ